MALRRVEIKPAKMENTIANVCAMPVIMPAAAAASSLSPPCCRTVSCVCERVAEPRDHFCQGGSREVHVPGGPVRTWTHRDRKVVRTTASPRAAKPPR